MSCLRTPNFLRLILLACLLFNVRAFAQFEIDPNHFDSETNRSVRDTVAKNKTRTTAPKNSESATQVASPYAVQLNQRIEEQRAIIAECRAQINAKRQQMEEAWQSLMRTGNEAGEGEALAIYHRDLLLKAPPTGVRLADAQTSGWTREWAETAFGPFFMS